MPLFQVRSRSKSTATEASSTVISEKVKSNDFTLYPEAEVMKNPESTMEVKYVHDFDIFRVHSFIAARVAHERTLLSVYLFEHSEHTELVSRCVYLNQQRKYLRLLGQLEEKIDNIRHGRIWNKYITEAGPLLREYQRLQGQGKVCRISKRPIVRTEKELQRTQLIQDYLNIAKKYAPIYVNRVQKLEAICPSCFTPQSEFVEEDCGSSCPNCGCFRETISNEKSFADSNNHITKTDYENRAYFHRAIICFQGKQKEDLPKTLIADLDNYFESRGFPTSRVVQGYDFIKITLPSGESVNSRFRRTTSLSLMLKALKATGNSSLYIHANLIMKKYWDCTLPDITQYEASLMELYDRCQFVYNQIPSAERRREAALNRQFQLYVSLRALGYYCSKTEFKLQKTQESLETHERNWRFICSRTGTRFFGVI